MDIAPGIYNTGTATVDAGGLVVSFQGASNLQAMVRPGDRFGGHVGLPIRIVSVDATTVTLAYPWPGPAQTAAPYEIGFTPYDLSYREEFGEIIKRYGRGTLPALAEMTVTADTILYGTGINTMASTPLTAFARTLLDDANAEEARDSLGATPTGAALFTAADTQAVRNAIGADNAGSLTAGTLPDARVSASLTPDKAFRRGNILGPVAQAGGIPTGAIIERGSNANGSYVRFADGSQFCWGEVVNIAEAIPGGAVTGALSFPSAFSALPTVSALCRTALSGRFSVSLAQAYTFGTEFNVTDTVGAGTPVPIQWQATGRWF